MKLYHLTLLPPAAVTFSAHGSFTAPRQQELVTVSASSIELYRLKHKEPRLHPLIRLDAFAQIRALDVFRLPATRRDYIVITSDAGTISILTADESTATFRTVHCETFGKTGCRRIVPGQFLACDPRGRACMVAAVEKQKFAYVLNRDSDEHLTISSPLEAHRSNCATFSLCAIDVGFENPMFAALEKSYDDQAHKLLVYYELDLGLNHIVRKHTSKVRPSSFLMFPVPGHTDGPGGVLICSFGYVTYRNLLYEDENGALLSVAHHVQHQRERNLEVRIPYRRGTDAEQTMIVSGTMYQNKKDNAFFFLLSTEHGDLLKAELEWDTEHTATKLRLVYFESMPAPALQMQIFRYGFLFITMEGSDTLLLKFQELKVSEDDPAGGQSTSTISIPNAAAPDPDAMEVDQVANGATQRTNGVPTSTSTAPVIQSNSENLCFTVRPELKFLSVVDVLDSFAPLLSICSTKHVAERPNGLLCSTGRAKSGSLRTLRRGMGVMEMPSTHVLPAHIDNVFAFKDRSESLYHRFIVVSFRDFTKVLKVGEKKVEEIFDSGFESNVSTLAAAQMGVDSLVQVYDDGVRFIPGGKVDDAREWKPPVPSKISAACCNEAQVLVALSTGDVVYFEVDGENGVLQEMKTISDVFVPTDGDDALVLGAVPSLALADIPGGRVRANFFAAGDGSNNKVRLFRIAVNGDVEQLGLHVAPGLVHSVALVDFGSEDENSGSGNGTRSGNTARVSLLTLLIGTIDGAIVRVGVDHVTGVMSGKHSMFLGAGKVRVQSIRMGRVRGCLVMGNETWMMHAQGGTVAGAPLATGGMECAAAFSSEQLPDGFVCGAGSRLKLRAVERTHALEAASEMPSVPPCAVPGVTSAGTGFFVERTRTDGTARKIIPVDGKGDLFVVIETDHRAGWSDNATNGTTAKRKKTVERGLTPAAAGCWVSKLVLVQLPAGDAESETADDEDDLDGSDVFLDFSSANAVKKLDSIGVKAANECILTAVTSAVLGGASETVYVVLSVAKKVVVSGTARVAGVDRCEESGALRVYRLNQGNKLELVHETLVDQPIYAMSAFRDMILVGSGQALRLYELGKRQLLRKSELRLAVRNRIVALAVAGGDRIFVGDVCDSVTLFRFMGGGSTGSAGQFVSIARDILPRWTVAMIAIDYSSVCVSDKFGNILLLRLPAELSGATEEYIGGMGHSGVGGSGGEAPHRLSLEACFHVGSTVLSLAQCSLRPSTLGNTGIGDERVIVYGSVQGAVGVLAALSHMVDVTFAVNVEREMRKRYRSVCGRDHISYRSSFYPVKNVVDGDLCEMMYSLSMSEEQCTEAFARPYEDVVRKLTDLRSHILG